MFRKNMECLFAGKGKDIVKTIEDLVEGRHLKDISDLPLDSSV